MRLDANIHGSGPEPVPGNKANPVEKQMGLLKAAFEREGGVRS